MKLFIRADDLNQQNYRDNLNCPISKALKRKFKREFLVIPNQASYLDKKSVYNMRPAKYTWSEQADAKVQDATYKSNKYGFHINITAV